MGGPFILRGCVTFNSRVLRAGCAHVRECPPFRVQSLRVQEFGAFGLNVRFGIAKPAAPSPQLACSYFGPPRFQLYILFESAVFGQSID